VPSTVPTKNHSHRTQTRVSATLAPPFQITVLGVRPQPRPRLQGVANPCTHCDFVREMRVIPQRSSSDDRRQGPRRILAAQPRNRQQFAGFRRLVVFAGTLRRPVFDSPVRAKMSATSACGFPVRAAIARVGGRQGGRAGRGAEILQLERNYTNDYLIVKGGAAARRPTARPTLQAGLPERG